MLVSVIRYNGADPAIRQAYAELASAPEIAFAAGGHEHAWKALMSRLELLLNLAGLPRSLAERGVKEAMLPTLAEEAARQWTASFNPLPVTKDDFLRLYTAAIAPTSQT
jgi:alcohol dehydrogenase